MGLDSYFFAEGAEDAEEIGYFRKHSDLHGWMVRELGGGVDECQEMPLKVSDLDRLMADVRDQKLPPTRGFFFGASTQDEAEIAYTLEVLEKVRDFMVRNPNVKVCYEASW
ncbi:phosphoglycerate kinase [bacterium]|nr:phosphoglycerate kinase [bacterium]